MQSMTYGILPTEEEFRAAYDATELRDGLFHFGNDKRLGNCALNCTDLWTEVCKAHEEYSNDMSEFDETGDWLSCVLDCLGFEWI
jgi:hypothetical protein